MVFKNNLKKALPPNQPLQLTKVLMDGPKILFKKEFQVILNYPIFAVQ